MANAWRKPLRAVPTLIALTGSFVAEAGAQGPYALVAGRWDSTVIVVDIGKAIAAGTDVAGNAIVARVRVTPDVASAVDGASPAPAAGLPSNVAISPDGRTVWVVNHAGNATAAATAHAAHGHAGTLAALNLRAAVDPRNDRTTFALQRVIAGVGIGPVGIAVLRDEPIAIVSSSEGADREDGGRVLTFVDLESGARVAGLPLALGDGGRVAQTAGHDCAALAADASLVPRTLPSSDVGCFPDTNGIAISRRDRPYAFTANGGTDDVSVIDLERALAADPHAEIARIPVGVGPWGIAVSATGDLVAVGNRESAETGIEGNTISILDVGRAVNGDARAEVARVIVGTDDASAPTRPFGIAFSPDGRALVSANFRTDNASIVSVERALAGRDDAELARIALTLPTGAPARPRGVAITADGRYAAISGGMRATAGSGWLWIVDLAAHTVVATVGGVGNEPYMIAIAAAGG